MNALSPHDVKSRLCAGIIDVFKQCNTLSFELEIALMGELWNELDVLNNSREDICRALYNELKGP